MVRKENWKNIQIPVKVWLCNLSECGMVPKG